MATSKIAFALAAILAAGFSAAPLNALEGEPVAKLLPSKLESQPCAGDIGAASQARALRAALQSNSGKETPEAAFATLPYSLAQRIVGFGAVNNGRYLAPNDCVYLVTVHHEPVLFLTPGPLGHKNGMVSKYTAMFDAATGSGLGTVAGQTIPDLITGEMITPRADVKTFTELRVTVAGKYVVGETVTAQVTSEPGVQQCIRTCTIEKHPVTYKYQWLRDGKPISKAIKHSYKLNDSDIGHNISVKVTATKSDYFDAEVKSTPKQVRPLTLTPGNYTAMINGRSEVTAKVPPEAATAKEWPLNLHICNSITAIVSGEKISSGITTLLLCEGAEGWDESVMKNALNKGPFKTTSPTQFEIGKITFNRIS